MRRKNYIEQNTNTTLGLMVAWLLLCSWLCCHLTQMEMDIICVFVLTFYGSTLNTNSVAYLKECMLSTSTVQINSLKSKENKADVKGINLDQS